MSMKYKKEKKNDINLMSAGFISFSDVNPADSSESQAPDGKSLRNTNISYYYNGNDSHLSQCCSKLMKKDSTTKVKSVNEILKILKDRIVQVIDDFLPYFMNIFPRLSLENNRQIREKLCEIFLLIIQYNKKILGPFMELSIGPWWILIGDPIHEVQQLAEKCFNEAIPKKKRVSVLLHLSEFLFNHFERSLFMSIEAVCELTGCTIEDGEEKIERITISTLFALGNILVVTATDSIQPSNPNLISDLPPFTKFIATLNSNEIFTKLLKSNSIQIRHATYQLLIKIFTHCPLVILQIFQQESSKPFVKTGENKSKTIPLHNLLLESLDDNHPMNTSSILDMMLKAFSIGSEYIWKLSKNIKIFYKKFQIFLAKHLIAWDYLLPLIASLPKSFLTIFALSTASEIEDKVSNKLPANVTDLIAFLESIVELLEKEEAFMNHRSKLIPLLSNQNDMMKDQSGLSNMNHKLICVFEVIATVLVRKTISNTSLPLASSDVMNTSHDSSNTVAYDPLHVEKLMKIAIKCIESIIISTILQNYQANFEPIRNQPEDDGDKDLTLRQQRLIQTFFNTRLTSTKENSKDNHIQYLTRVFYQLHRATFLQTHGVSSTLWNNWIWDPISSLFKNIVHITVDEVFTDELIHGVESSDLPKLRLTDSIVLAIVSMTTVSSMLGQLLAIHQVSPTLSVHAPSQYGIFQIFKCLQLSCTTVLTNKKVDSIGLVTESDGLQENEHISELIRIRPIKHLVRLCLNLRFLAIVSNMWICFGSQDAEAISCKHWLEVLHAASVSWLKELIAMFCQICDSGTKSSSIHIFSNTVGMLVEHIVSADDCELQNFFNGVEPNANNQILEAYKAVFECCSKSDFQNFEFSLKLLIDHVLRCVIDESFKVSRNWTILPWQSIENLFNSYSRRLTVNISQSNSSTVQRNEAIEFLTICIVLYHTMIQRGFDMNSYLISNGLPLVDYNSTQIIRLNVSDIDEQTEMWLYCSVLLNLREQGIPSQNNQVYLSKWVDHNADRLIQSFATLYEHEEFHSHAITATTFDFVSKIQLCTSRIQFKNFVLPKCSASFKIAIIKRLSTDLLEAFNELIVGFNTKDELESNCILHAKNIRKYYELISSVFLDSQFEHFDQKFKHPISLVEFWSSNNESLLKVCIELDGISKLSSSAIQDFIQSSIILSHLKKISCLQSLLLLGTSSQYLKSDLVTINPYAEYLESTNFYHFIEIFSKTDLVGEILNFFQITRLFADYMKRMDTMYAYPDQLDLILNRIIQLNQMWTTDNSYLTEEYTMEFINKMQMIQTINMKASTIESKVLDMRNKCEHDMVAGVLNALFVWKQCNTDGFPFIEYINQYFNNNSNGPVRLISPTANESKYNMNKDGQNRLVYLTNTESNEYRPQMDSIVRQDQMMRIHSIQALPCELVRIHHDGFSEVVGQPVEPYFTVRIQSGDELREIQTTWNKILFQNWNESQDSVAKIDIFKIEEKTTNSNKPSAIVDWLRASTYNPPWSFNLNLDSLNQSGPSSRSVIHQILHHTNLYSTILNHYCQYLTNDSENLVSQQEKATFTNAVVPCIRGHIQQLLDACCQGIYGKSVNFKDFPNKPKLQFLVALHLLSSLASFSIGIGNGLWIPDILQKIEIFVKALILSDKEDKSTPQKAITNNSEMVIKTLSKDSILADCLDAFSAIARCVYSPRCLSLSDEMVSKALRSLPSQSSEFLPINLVLMLRELWRSRTPQHVLFNMKKSISHGNMKAVRKSPSDIDFSSSSMDLTRSPIRDEGNGSDGNETAEALLHWEIEGFDLVLIIFMEGINQNLMTHFGSKWYWLNDGSIRLLAASAIHYCFLSKSSTAIQKLLLHSFINKFIPALERMILSVDSKQLIKDSVHPMGLKMSGDDMLTIRLTAAKLLYGLIDQGHLNLDNNLYQVTTTSSSTTSSSNGIGNAVTPEVTLHAVLMNILTQASKSGNATAAKCLQRIQDESSGILKVENATDIKMAELQELSTDEVVFQYVVGSQYFEDISRRFANESSAVKWSNQFRSRKDKNKLALKSRRDGIEALKDASYHDKSNKIRIESMDSPLQSETATEYGDDDDATNDVDPMTNPNKMINMDDTSDTLGNILMWMICLKKIDKLSIHYGELKIRCGNYLQKSGLLSNIIFYLLNISPDLLICKDVANIFSSMEMITSNKSYNKIEGKLSHLSIYALYRSICCLPAVIRAYWNDDLNRVQKNNLIKFVVDRVRTALIKREISLINLSKQNKIWKDDELEVKGSVNTGEIIAAIIREETRMEIKIRLPPSYPLKNVEVTCTSKFGVHENKWRRWILRITQLLSSQDGCIIDAILMWKKNLEKELDGVEPCPICYCILDAKTSALPTLSCPTCKNKFHSSCLYTWFQSSGKAKCVLCQQPFFN